MNITSTYVHALEGRLRIKVNEVKGSSQKAREIEGDLQTLAGINNVQANPTTGNVLILYNQRFLTQRHIIAALQDLGCLQNNAPINSRTEIANRSQEGIGKGIVMTVTQTLMELALTRLVSAII